MLLSGQSPDEGNGKLQSPVAGPAITKVTMKSESRGVTDAVRYCSVSRDTVQSVY
jgi:hypothetical protein